MARSSRSAPRNLIGDMTGQTVASDGAEADGGTGGDALGAGTQHSLDHADLVGDIEVVHPGPQAGVEDWAGG